MKLCDHEGVAPVIMRRIYEVQFCDEEYQRLISPELTCCCIDNCLLGGNTVANGDVQRVRVGPSKGFFPVLEFLNVTQKRFT